VASGGALSRASTGALDRDRRPSSGTYRPFRLQIRRNRLPMWRFTGGNPPCFAYCDAPSKIGQSGEYLRISGGNPWEGKAMWEGAYA